MSLLKKKDLELSFRQKLRDMMLGDELMEDLDLNLTYGGAKNQPICHFLTFFRFLKNLGVEKSNKM